MKTEDLRAFDAVVRHGSISEGARALNLTQPATTRRIQSLEEDLGVQLLDRSTKPPRPSVLGLRVHARTRAALREIDALRDLVAADAEPAGELRLGLTHSMGAADLVDVVRGLHAAFPQVLLQLSADWSARLVARVADGGLNAAAVFMPSGTLWPEGLLTRRLASTDVVVVAARGRFGPAGRRLRGLVEAGWILNPEGCGFRAALQRALAEQGLPFRLALEIHGSELQLGLAAAGLGLAFVSRPALAASRHAAALDVLTLRDFRLAVDVWLVSAPFQASLQRAIDAFGDAVAQGLGAAAPAAAAVRRRR